MSHDMKDEMCDFDEEEKGFTFPGFMPAALQSGKDACHDSFPRDMTTHD